MADVYDRLGVTRRINGAGLLTRLGGSLMAPAVLDAMREAAGAFVDMTELQTRASDVIARHTGAEAGIVTGGAAAAMTLATAACLARWDVRVMERLPDTEGFANEVIMFRAHRNGYDHAIRAAGARIVDIGFNDVAIGAGVRGLEAWEIEAAISQRTVAVAFTAGQAGQASLPMVCEVAARHGLPVLVDAAAQLPPRRICGGSSPKARRWWRIAAARRSGVRRGPASWPGVATSSPPRSCSNSTWMSLRRPGGRRRG